MKIALLVVLLLLALVLLISYCFFYMGIVRYEKKPGRKKPSYGRYDDIIAEGTGWFRAQECERVTLSSYDGIPLAALFLPAEEAKGTIVLCHGYRMDGYTDFACVYKLYHELGYNILNIFQRAHGESGGKYITFGVKERFDVSRWAWYVYDRFGRDHNIFLGGLSMGTSSVLMATGTELPPNVRAVFADCGFTSPYDEFCYVLRERFHLPIHPIIDLADSYASLFAGFSFSDYSTLTAMETNRIPVLFIHGEEDRLVPLKSTIQNYGACKAPKKLITVPNATHGFSYLYDTKACKSAVMEFLNKYTVPAKQEKPLQYSD